MARALVTGVAYHHRKRSTECLNRYKSLCRGKPCHRSQALDLHAKAGVNVSGTCGLVEARAFERALNEEYESPLYRVVIYGQEHFGQVIYQGEPTLHQLTLWYCEDHYDLVMNPVAFLEVLITVPSV